MSMEERMKRTIAALVVAVLGLGLGIVGAADPKLEEAASAKAEAWLALVDQGKYGESWDQAAALFKGALTRARWEEQVGAVRTPLGKLVSRKLKSRQFAESLPGAPDGKYVVIQYDTVFENKKSAVETVTPMQDADGSWRVSGYYIK
jgi:hypothetical protein